jgi:hypothetical protein
MVMRNKFHRILDKYRTLLKTRVKRAKTKKTTGGLHYILKGNVTKNKILDFYLKTNRWPSRLSKNGSEKTLGHRFENYVSKEAGSYDAQLRRIVMTAGRKTNNKRKHNVTKHKADIVEFMKKYGRAPITHRRFAKIEGESLLRSRLDYYTNEKKDMALLGKVYEQDKCHRSGIPSRFRPIINEALKTSRPLIRLA